MAIPYSKLNGFIQKTKRVDNQSGITGVSFNNTTNRWEARLNFNKKLYWGKMHKNSLDAIRARLTLELDVLGIERMPQRNLVPKYFTDGRDRVLKAYKKFSEGEEK